MNPPQCFVRFTEADGGGLSFDSLRGKSTGGNGFMKTVKKEYNKLDGMYNMVKYAILIRNGGDTGITDDVIRSTTAEVISFFELEGLTPAKYRELVTMLRRRFNVCE